MKNLCLLVGILGFVLQADATPVLNDHFDGSTVSTSNWTTSGNVGVSGSYLSANSGGSIRSTVTGSVAADGELTAIFTHTGTDDWSVNNMEMGLYSADGTQCIRISQPGYYDFTSVSIVSDTGTAVDFLDRSGWGISGPELRDAGCSQTWKITVTTAAVNIYVNDVLKATYNQGQGSYADPVDIPTVSLAVGFQGNSSGNFKVDQITFVPEPGILLMLVMGGLGFIRRK
jgi:hypothetical protein